MRRFDSLGIMGGTFDPVHYGHLIAAEYARYEFGLKEVVFMPAARPPHKKMEQVLDGRHRYEMLRRAVKDNPAFTVSDLEMKRAGNSYTIDTIRYFLKERPGKAVFFIMGADSLLTMTTWKDYQHLARLCRFVVVTRPGYALGENEPLLKQLPLALWENVRFLPIPAIDISSSDIRERAAAGRPIKYLLPDEVERYIAETGLYRGRGGD